jgi:hypothetical protein
MDKELALWPQPDCVSLVHPRTRRTKTMIRNRAAIWRLGMPAPRLLQSAPAPILPSRSVTVCHQSPHRGSGIGHLATRFLSFKSQIASRTSSSSTYTSNSKALMVRKSDAESRSRRILAYVVAVRVSWQAAFLLNSDRSMARCFSSGLAAANSVTGLAAHVCMTSWNAISVSKGKT